MINSRTAQFPLSLKEREEFAGSLSYRQIFDLSRKFVDHERRRKNKWKYFVRMYYHLQTPPYNRKDIEKALWKNDVFRIDEDRFIACLNSEFTFAINSFEIESDLRGVFKCMEGAAHEDSVDWRDILSCYYVIYYFRFVRNDPMAILLKMFNLYSAGDNKGRSLHPNDFRMENWREYLTRIFTLPCISEVDIHTIKTLAKDLLDAVLPAFGRSILRRQFSAALEQYDPTLVKHWAKLCWDRLPSELHLCVMDEAQQLHHHNAETILLRHKLNQAIAIYYKNTVKHIFKEWKLVMLRESGLRNFIVRKRYRKRDKLFRFWLQFTAFKRVRRRRRFLAEVMGKYAIKARCFKRIQLFNYNTRRVRVLVGDIDRAGKFQKLAGSHLRAFRRFNQLKTFYHRWWNKCVDMINHEASEDHNRTRLLRKAMLPWYRYATEKAMLKRMELMTLENKLHFDRMIQEAEESAQLLHRLEEERRQKEEQETQLRRQEEARLRLEKAKKEAKDRKEAEKKVILSIQQEARKKRIRKQMKKMKKKFKESWQRKSEEMIQKAKDRITAYIENPDNALAIKMNFEQVKRDFYAPPTAETHERERILSSVKNILFLHLQAKLREDMLQLEDLIPQFDKDKKGYLTYKEFAELIRSIGAGLNPSQIGAVIRGVDADGDGFIDLKELEESMKETESMGVPGSPWRLYIDPAEDVICYHNFVTGQRIFEYQMKDKVLKEITIANMYGEADRDAVAEIQKKKAEEWDSLIRNYMAKRIQRMARARLARKWRQKKIWKVQKRENQAKTQLQRRCVRFIEKSFMGWITRVAFKKQLHLALEKVYEVETGRLFWHNHITHSSSWQKPRLLERYGDVTEPSPWVPIEVPVEGHPDSSQPASAAADVETMYRIHYFHIPSKKEIPRKPDGLLLCTSCTRNVALHTCLECQAHYCFSCHRETHSHPLGFYQKTKAAKAQFSDPAFVERMNNAHHSWRPTPPLLCQICHSKKLFAGIYCNQCNLQLCRICSQRIHGHPKNQNHDMYQV